LAFNLTIQKILSKNWSL